MLKIKELVFLYEDENIKKFEFGNKLISLTGKSKSGKSTFLNLIYTLLGSKTTFQKWISEKVEHFRARGIREVVLLIELNGKIMRNVFNIENGILFYSELYTGDKFKMIDSGNDPTCFKKIIKRNMESMQFPTYNGSKRSTIVVDIYTVNAFFHGFNSESKIFTSSSNSWTTNALIDLYTYNLPANDLKIVESLHKEIIHLNSLENKSQQFLLLSREKDILKNAINEIFSSEKHTEKNIPSILGKLENLYRERQVVYMLSTRPQTKINYDMLFNLVENSNFNAQDKNALREEITKDALKNGDIHFDQKKIEESLKQINEKISKQKNELEKTFKRSNSEFLAWEKFRRPQIDEELKQLESSNGHSEKEVSKTKESVLELESKVRDIRKNNSNTIVSKMNQLVAELDLVDKIGNAISYNKLEFRFGFENMGLANTTYASIEAVLLVILFADVSSTFDDKTRQQYTPSLISLNRLLVDANDDDYEILITNAKKISDKIANVSRKTKTIFIFQDKRGVFSKFSQEINVEKEEIFIKL